LISPQSDGNLWFVNKFENIIGRVTTTGVITEFIVPTANAHHRILRRPGRNLYFTEPPINEIVKITPMVSSRMCSNKACRQPMGIARDAARNLWITQIDGNKISRLLIPSIRQNQPSSSRLG